MSGRGAARLRAGHPWVYRSDVLRAGGEAGDVVRVEDRRGRFLGYAFYNPRSEITLRVAERREGVKIGGEWFYGRLRAALEYRAGLGMDGDACRLLHAEADGVPGLVADRYGDYVVLQVGSAAVERRLEMVSDALEELLSPAGVLLRGDAGSRRREGLRRTVAVLRGRVPETVVVREGPVRYRVALWRGQKTGAFLDQRENRLAAGRYARGRVLDVFSYTGGFALHAARRAEHVEAVDSSGAALEAARENARLNRLSNLSFTEANVFDLLRARSDAGEVYDAVILDPPAFARTRRDLPRASRAYKEINLRAMKLLAPGGILITCSCSYHFSREAMEEMLRSAAADAGRSLRVREWRGQAPDHPEVLNIPETRYLKCAVLERLA
ncbi:class I SAM-dependent rRNA methyltransferase [Rubrobacter xylanophilus]|uniref:class I SAM-dependent rRNA methyltransferase n=1 Tax=Rubrobacter xylanophilus TaxID=49319 RepID=UPI0018D6213D|nr:class I SAM-dependent rRNA methyltransferase [Rubrobacter xylanophilus]